MATPQQDIERFGAYLTRRNYAAHTIESYTLDLQLFFADKDRPSATVTHVDVEQFAAQQHAQGLTPTTLNRHLFALKHFFDFLLEHKQVVRAWITQGVAYVPALLLTDDEIAI